MQAHSWHQINDTWPNDQNCYKKQWLSSKAAKRSHTLNGGAGFPLKEALTEIFQHTWIILYLTATSTFFFFLLSTHVYFIWTFLPQRAKGKHRSHQGRALHCQQACCAMWHKREKCEMLWFGWTHSTRSTWTKPTAAEGLLYNIYLPNGFQMGKSPVRSWRFLKDYSAQTH